MKRMSRRLLAAILTLALALLTACTGEEAKPTATPMGRYTEDVLSLPDSLVSVTGFRAGGDGVLELLGYLKSGLGYFRSVDGGATWTAESPAWMENFNGEASTYFAAMAAWDAGGTLHLGVEYTENSVQRRALARIEGDGLRLLDWELPSASTGSVPKGMGFAENGDVLLDCWSELLQADTATGAVKQVYTAEKDGGGFWNDGWAVNGNTLVLSECDKLTWYDLTTGKETRSLSCAGGSVEDYSGSYRVMDFLPDGSLLFADPAGLIRATDGSDTLEGLADGALTSLAAPTIRRVALVAMEGRYLVLAREGAVFKLFSYTYGANTPTLPAKELTVWSLTSNAIIHQAITSLQKSDPDLRVTYQIGQSGKDAVTREDALRALATQITAGKCPDLLVLDGIPVDAYVEKGALADLSGRVDGLTGSGKVLPNIMDAYRQEDGSVYAVPARFQVPMLHGSDAAMDAIHDLTSMADWLEENQDSYTSYPIGAIYTRQDLLNFLYPVLASSLTGPDGGMDRDKLSDFLLQVRRILDLRSTEKDWDAKGYPITYFCHGATDVKAGISALNAGFMTSYQGYYAAWTVCKDMGGGRVDMLFDTLAFLPVTVMGMSAQSKQQDLCWRFIETVLSEEQQQTLPQYGIPVSSAALDAAPTAPVNPEYFDSLIYNAAGEKVCIGVMVEYPPEEYRAEMLGRLKSLDTPLFYDATVFQLICDGAADYFSGTSTLDTAVDGIIQKLELYDKEAG